ncbi:S8 family peptidase [Hathewaya limosa]|uniref:S8 family peptidase n=1 Tax=Hathewaya limosa TaxID=1536 RepID=UPI0027D7B8E0|nr:S8 family peptidase [Hathewaya limosa]
MKLIFKVIKIENTEGILNLLKFVPNDIKTKILSYNKIENLENIEVVVLINGDSNSVLRQVKTFDGNFEYLGYGFGIVTVPIGKLEEISNIKEIVYMELPKTLYTSYAPSNSASCVDEVQSKYKLTGKGVLVGFIDSGIDYTHPAFIDEQGNTRIKYIYDLDKKQDWNEEEINKAIKSPNPYAIVPERDQLGHGTHVTGIACAGGKIDKKFYGVAYESNIAMVKMTREGKISYAKSTQLMRGIRYLIDKSKELNLPLVLNLSFSTNDGAHDGKSLLELYIQTIIGLERLTFVIAAGNEGSTDHHVGGKLDTENIISFNIAKGENIITLQLYKSFTDDISIEIRNPMGRTSGVINIYEKGYSNGNLGSDSYYIYNSGPTPFNINGEILIVLQSASGEITSGIWDLRLINVESLIGGYDIWLPIAEGLNIQTKFLNPNPYNTLGIPATVYNAVSVGSYNFLTNTISSFSGRGKRNSSVIKPDIVSPGEKIESSIPGGGFDSLSGTSMATPEVTGAVALLTEWGLVKGNDPYLYGERLKYYLLKGARRNRSDIIYPNPSWGYGSLCLNNAFNIWLEEGNVRMNKDYNRLDKTREYCGSQYIDEGYHNYIVEYDGDIETVLNKTGYACGFILDDNYAVISVKDGYKDKLLADVPEIVYLERNTLYTLNDVSPMQSANVYKFHDNPFLTLRGNGVLVGIVDTGIDYLDLDFMYEDDTTRIVGIWDQTIPDTKNPQELGSYYTSENINEAIKSKKEGKNPYDIVPSKDEIGHGTSVAGVIGSRGRLAPIGAAPDSEFAIVKLRTTKHNTFKEQNPSNYLDMVYSSTDIILGIRYLYSIGKKMNMPIVIYVPLGTNMGGHDGSSILERYIDDISKTRGVAVVTSTGNEGDSATHTSGRFQQSGEIKSVELKVDEKERSLSFEVWANKPDKISIGLVSPSGEVIEKIPAKLKEQEEIKFVFEGSIATINYYFPEESTGDELIIVKITNIKGGIWQIRLTGDLIIDGKFDIWLPQRPLIKADTRFLKPDPDITLTIPSTGKNILTTSTYDQNNDTIVPFSGNGYTRDGRIKPDLTSGGVNVLTTGLNNKEVTVSGGSVSGAVFAGAVALLLQWGIVDKNDETMYSTKIKTYLIRGTKKRAGDMYPNRQWGYGRLDLNGVFENIRSLDRGSRMIKKNTLKVVLPKDIYKYL